MKYLLSAFLVFSLIQPLLAENTISETIGFGGGLNVKTIPTDIDDDESPDMSNMINDRYGSSFKRDGSERYIFQAISTQPITSLYRVYVPSTTSTGSTTNKALIATSGNSIYYSTNDVNPSWIVLSSNIIGANQHWSFAMMNNLVIMAGDAQTDNMKKFNLLTSSFSDLLFNYSTEAVNVRPKYIISANNYLIGANCVLSDFVTNVSTSYFSRTYYSLLVQPSSFTALRYIDLGSDDGDQVMGIGMMKSFVNFYKQNSVYEMSFSNLNLTSQGGDQKVVKFIAGFGVLAPRTLQSDGNYYYFFARDGIRRWDGGEKSRLNVTDESEIISGRVKPIIDQVIKSGTYANSSAKYYPKRGWYMLAYEDPTRYPRGRANSVLVYDIKKSMWFPFRNWNVECWESLDGFGDLGQLMYGDSNDGYAYFVDLGSFPDDARKELPLDTMDSTATWSRGTQDTTSVLEGTASQKMTLTFSANMSSITNMGLFPVGEWTDKSIITKKDLLSFKVYPSSIQNISSIRIDLELSDVSGDFDTNFTSVTISSSALYNGNNSWSTIGIALSSFPILDSWTNILNGNLVFANTLTWYGIRFVVNSVSSCTVSIDDLRIVQATKNPLNSYRYTKQFNLGNPLDKKFNGIILTREAGADSTFSMDVINNFGQISGSYNFSGNFGKELFVGDFNGGNNVTRLNSIDFSVLESTNAGNKTIFAARPIAVDEKRVYVGDQYNNRIFSIDKSTISSGVFISTYGTIGPGTSNFYLISQIAVDDKYLYVCDSGNRRIKIHNKNDLSYVNSFGTLGSGTTSYDFPTGVAVDEKFIYVVDDGNYRINKYDKVTLSLKNIIFLNLNIIGDTTLAVDESALYDCYKIRSKNSFNLDLVLEKRNKNDLSLISKTIIRPKSNPTLVSSYTVLGDISLSDKYIYVTFSDDINLNGSFYIQKLNKVDFSIVNEYKTSSGKFFSATANGYSYLPKLKQLYQPISPEGNYIQFKFYDSILDNNFKLINHTLIFDQRPVQEKN